VAALMTIPGVAKTHTTPEPPTDIVILNYALTLEYLKYAFYRDGLKKFDDNDFEKFFKKDRRYRKQGIKELDGEAVRREFVRIRNHEQTHVKTLQSVIKSLGGKPVPECTYNFNKTAFTSVGKFVSVTHSFASANFGERAF
jgi:rubrerythrin